MTLICSIIQIKMQSLGITRIEKQRTLTELQRQLPCIVLLVDSGAGVSFYISPEKVTHTASFQRQYRQCLRLFFLGLLVLV